MTLLNPLGLIGLLSLPVILALHLMRKRQRRYVVSHLELWSFLETQAQGPRIRRIPLTWILVLDLLIAALLSLAWAQPRVDLGLLFERERHLVILLDVSSSMRARDGAGLASRFERAKAEAAALVDGAGPDDVVTVVTFGRRAVILADSRQDGAEMLARIESARVGETGSALREALALGQSVLERDLPAEFHVLTDGNFPQESLGEAGEFAHPLHWRMSGIAVDNQAVIALNATRLAENRLQIFARIANYGSSAVTREAVLEVDGAEIDRSVIDLPADASVPRVWQIPAEAAGTAEAVTIRLQGADGLAEDDSAVIGLQAGGDIRVALVAEDPAVIQQAVLAVPGVELEVLSPVAYDSSLVMDSERAFDLTIFRGVFPSSWPAGQVLVVDPPTAGSGQGSVPATGGISLYAASSREVPANTAVRAPNPDPLVDGIDFSGVRWQRVWSLGSLPPGFIPVLQAGDVPILLQSEIPSAAGRSRVAVLLADLSLGNFTKHPAFPILMANLVERSRQAPLPPGFQTGEAVPLPAVGSYQAVEVTTPGQDVVELARDWPEAWTGTLDPGLYQFRFIEADGETSEFTAGARAGDAVESDLQPRGWLQTAAAGRGPGGTGVEEDRPVDLRPWLMGAALLTLLLEATLAWRR